MKHPLLPSLLLLVLVSCGRSNKHPIKNEQPVDASKFPEVTTLASYDNTRFSATLEEPLNTDKNAVYAASLLFAWNEIRSSINKPIRVDTNFRELYLLNNSKSHINSLNDNEIETSVNVEGDAISARAYFKKMLPFEFSFNRLDSLLKFNGVKVAALGVSGYWEHKYWVIKILYYKDDDDFVVQLNPHDTSHSIILFNTREHFSSMTSIITMINSKIRLGQQEAKDEKLVWKYDFATEDELTMPVIKFNIETNYSTLEGKGFTAGEKVFSITTAYQRTAFLLDETGAAVESEADVSVDSAAVEIPVEYKPKPKHMIFNKPFFLMLKRNDSKNPYFGLWIANTELMIKQ